MKKEFIALLGAVLLLLLALFAFRGEVLKLFLADITADMFVTSDLDDFDPGLPTGSAFPAIDARYRGQTITRVDSLMGDKGMVFVAVRSVDWCPYCMRQLAQLQGELPKFNQAGIGLVAMSYDTPALQQPFIEARGITYPLLADNAAASAIALGILNNQYQPGDEHYGIPHPGVFVLDRNGMIVGKLFLEAYSSRVDAGSVLAYAQDLLGAE